MNRNPKKVRDLNASIEIFKMEILQLKNQLRFEQELVPLGYELIGACNEVKEGAIGYEPHTRNWHKVYNSVGNLLNEQGYITGITHKGWKYANLINKYKL